MKSVAYNEEYAEAAISIAKAVDAPPADFPRHAQIRGKPRVNAQNSFVIRIRAAARKLLAVAERVRSGERHRTAIFLAECDGIEVIPVAGRESAFPSASEIVL